MSNHTKYLAPSVSFDDYEEFVGGDTDEDDGNLCKKCNAYPCECLNEGDEDE